MKKHGERYEIGNVKKEGIENFAAFFLLIAKLSNLQTKIALPSKHMTILFLFCTILSAISNYWEIVYQQKKHYP